MMVIGQYCLLSYHLMSSNSGSESPEGKKNDEARKVFITNIDGQKAEELVETELRNLFAKHGQIQKLNVKKNKNGQYSFAFLEFQTATSAAEAIKELDQYQLFGKKMRVRQDRQSEGCFNCKKSGHFARECPEKQPTGDRYQPRQRYSRDRSEERLERMYGRNDRERGRQRQRQDRYSKRYQRERSRSSSGQRHHRRRHQRRSRSNSYDRRRDHRDDRERDHRDDRERDHRNDHERDHRDDRERHYRDRRDRSPEHGHGRYRQNRRYRSGSRSRSRSG